MWSRSGRAGDPTTGREGLHEIGCTAALREVRRLPDGRFDIITVGDRRFRLLDVDDTAAPYLVANVEWIPDLEGDDPAALEPLERAARAAHRRYSTTARTYRRHADEETGEPAALDAEADPEPDVECPPTSTAEEDGPVDAAILAHVLAADCLLPLGDRQELLDRRARRSGWSWSRTRWRARPSSSAGSTRCGRRPRSSRCPPATTEPQASGRPRSSTPRAIAHSR